MLGDLVWTLVFGDSHAIFRQLHKLGVLFNGAKQVVRDGYFLLSEVLQPDRFQ